MAASIAVWSLTPESLIELVAVQKAKGRCTDIARRLRKHACCPRCVLRYLGVGRGQAYLASEQELWRALRLEDNSVSVRIDESANPSCGACLGVLQEFCHKDFIEKVAHQVSTSGYEYSSFSCSVSLPVGADLREYAYLLIAEEVCPDAFGGIKIDDLPSAKDVWRWVCGPVLSDRLGVPQGQNQLEVLVEFQHAEADKECNPLMDIFPQTFKNRKNSKLDIYTRVNVRQAMSDMSRDKFRRRMRYPPPALTSPCICTAITCSNPPLFIAGRYNKYTRKLSQTPWFINGVRKSSTSVEELVCEKIMEAVQAKEYRFSSSGREDCDVRMLGRGRPFVIEFIDPKHALLPDAALETLQTEINASTQLIAIRDLQIVKRQETSILKEGEEEKKKWYSAWCICREEITKEDLERMHPIKDLTLLQKTPVRVLHRRPLVTRARIVHSLAAVWLDAHHFTLRLQTQAGTYVKEFVHGDFGRTEPNLRSLLAKECDIITLDVESVEVSWPPALPHRDPEAVNAASNCKDGADL